MDAVGQFTVYGLVDSGEPDHIRYVGQTKDLTNRLAFHRQMYERYPVNLWKRGVMFLGREYRVVELELVEGTRADSMACEKFFIDTLTAGGARLVNGDIYRARHKREGISSYEAAAYLQLLDGLFRMQMRLEDREALEALAGGIDQLESARKPLCLFRTVFQEGCYDSFREYVQQRLSASLIAT